MQISPITGLLEAKRREFTERKSKFSVQDFSEIEANLETTVTSQKALGLGNPELASRNLKGGLKAVMGAQEANQLALVGNVHYIEDPTTSVDLFEVASGAQAFTNSKQYKAAPDLVICKLTAETKEVLCSLEGNGGREQKKAAIPVIPAIIQEIAQRAKEAAPNAEFFTVFQASWEPAPMKDPALLARIKDSHNKADHWFLLGQAWGGDAELIKEHLLEKRA